MQPIVDGLEDEFGKTVVFQQINAGTGEGYKIFKAYSLFGHPSFLLLDEKGNVLWQSVGEQPGENIKAALVTFLGQ
jgi:hypothetical protein